MNYVILVVCVTLIAAYSYKRLVAFNLTCKLKVALANLHLDKLKETPLTLPVAEQQYAGIANNGIGQLLGPGYRIAMIHRRNEMLYLTLLQLNGSIGNLAALTQLLDNNDCSKVLVPALVPVFLGTANFDTLLYYKVGFYS